MTFEIIAWVMTVAGTVLGLRFIVAGASILKEWGIAATSGALVVCRRLGAVYLGLALTFFLGRGAAPSSSRDGLCLGIGGASAMLACLGVFGIETHAIREDGLGRDGMEHVPRGLEAEVHAALQGNRPARRRVDDAATIRPRSSPCLRP